MTRFWLSAPFCLAMVAAASANDVSGAWTAVFTGPQGERPKMVSEIILELKAEGDILTGTARAGKWPGEAEVTDGKVEGNRVTFTMIGHIPFRAGRPGAMVTGYPKLCFAGIRDGNEMKIDLLWTTAADSCEGGRLLPMVAKKRSE